MTRTRNVVLFGGILAIIGVLLWYAKQSMSRDRFFVLLLVGAVVITGLELLVAKRIRRR